MFNKLKEFYYSHQEENIHAIKYALAFVIGYFVMQLLPPGKSQWIIITIAVVMGSQIVVGDHVLKSILRALGTLFGAAIGVITILLPQDHIIVLALIVILAIFFSKLASRYSDLSYVAILGMITFSMIALAPNPSWHLAVMRVTDILIGIAIALFVSTVIFPLNSRRAFILQSVRNFKTIAEFISKIYLDEINRRYDPTLIRLESKIVNGVVKQRAIIKAIRFEPIKKAKLQTKLTDLVRYSRAIYHYIVVIDVAMHELIDELSDNHQLLQQKLQPCMQIIITLLHSFAVEKTVVIEVSLLQNLQQCIASLNKIKTQLHIDKDDSALEAICFSLNRISVCFLNLMENWNQIQKL